MRLALTLACALLAASCASTANRRTGEGYVQVLSSGTILVNGRSVAVSQVGPTLRSRGFGPSSQINVHVPNEISQRILKMVTVSLTNSGFTRVIFIKPKQTSSDVKPLAPGK